MAARPRGPVGLGAAAAGPRGPLATAYRQKRHVRAQAGTTAAGVAAATLWAAPELFQVVIPVEGTKEQALHYAAALLPVLLKHLREMVEEYEREEREDYGDAGRSGPEDAPLYLCGDPKVWLQPGKRDGVAVENRFLLAWEVGMSSGFQQFVARQRDAEAHGSHFVLRVQRPAPAQPMRIPCYVRRSGKGMAWTMLGLEHTTLHTTGWDRYWPEEAVRLAMAESFGWEVEAMQRHEVGGIPVLGHWQVTVVGTPAGLPAPDVALDVWDKGSRKTLFGVCAWVVVEHEVLYTRLPALPKPPPPTNAWGGRHAQQGPAGSPNTNQPAGPGTQPAAGPGTQPAAGPGTQPAAGSAGDTQQAAGPGTQQADDTVPQPPSGPGAQPSAGPAPRPAADAEVAAAAATGTAAAGAPAADRQQPAAASGQAATRTADGASTSGRTATPQGGGAGQGLPQRNTGAPGGQSKGPKGQQRPTSPTAQRTAQRARTAGDGPDGAMAVA
jgi:hypothetical protein